MSKSQDMIVRAMTADGAFRILTALTTETVRGAAQMQEARGITAQRLGELITGAVLVREAMSPDRRVQALVKDKKGRTRLVADAHPSGWNRGIVNPRSEDEGGTDAILEVLYTLPNDVLQQGIVALPDSGDISAGLMTYMQESEQVVSMIAVRTVTDQDAGVRAAGGYMVQLLPDAPRAALQRMTERLSSFAMSAELDEQLCTPGASAEALRQALVGNIATKPMAHMFLCFGCNCDIGRILAGLGSLPGAEIAEMIEAGEALDIRCEACGKHYQITIADLRELANGRRTARAHDESLQN